MLPVMPGRSVAALVLVGALAFPATLAGCGAAGIPRPAAQAPGSLQVLVEPDAGFAPIDDLIASASQTLDMTMYELADPGAESALADDERRGVKVRVLLDRNREGTTNASARQFLLDHGVSVEWAPPAFEADHEKAIVVDGRRLVVLTANLASRYYADTRDFVLVDTDTADVSGAESAFASDWAGRPGQPPAGEGLVWSPGSEAALVALVGAARHTLQVENEEMSDRAVIDELIAAARRGVDVEVTMTDSNDWHQAFDRLVAAGVHVAIDPDPARTGHDLYVHAKAVVVDAGTPGGRLFVGSQNFTAASLDRNRELGLVVQDTAVVSLLARTLAGDHAAAAPWAVRT